MVREVADLAVVPAGAEVLDEVVRRDDGLGLERQRRARDAGDGLEHLRDRVDLGLVLAGRAHPLPQEGDRVEPEHLHAEVGEEQDDLGELDEDVRVRPVEVPLPGVERRPHPLLELLVPGEVARREVREHLGQRPLVGVGLGPVGVDVEVVLVVLLARPRADRPVVLARDVVEDQVEDEAHPVLAQRGRQVAEVVDRPEVGADRAVVPHRVPAVVVARPRLEQRHEVEVGHAQLAQVRDLVLDAPEVVGEPLGVGGVAHHPRQLEPVGLQRTPDVEDVQVVRTLDERLMGQADQTVCERERRVVPVQRLQGLDEVAAASLDAKLEELLAVGADGHAPNPTAPASTAWKAAAPAVRLSRGGAMRG